MNLTEVNTVGELVLENERTLTPEERATLCLSKCGPEFHLATAKVMLQALRDYHITEAKHMLEEGNENGVVWVVDANKLDNALTLLENVTL